MFIYGDISLRVKRMLARITATQIPYQFGSTAFAACISAIQSSLIRCQCGSTAFCRQISAIQSSRIPCQCRSTAFCRPYQCDSIDFDPVSMRINRILHPVSVRFSRVSSRIIAGQAFFGPINHCLYSHYTAGQVGLDPFSGVGPR